MNNNKKLELFQKKLVRISGQGLAKEKASSRIVSLLDIFKADGCAVALVPFRGDAMKALLRR